MMCTGEREAAFRLSPYLGGSLLSPPCLDPMAQRAEQDRDEVWPLPAPMGGEGIEGLLAGEALPEIVWSMGSTCETFLGLPRKSLREHFPLSAASGLSSGRSSLRRNHIQVADSSETLRWGPERGCGKAKGLRGQDKWQVCLLFRGSHPRPPPFLPLLSGARFTVKGRAGVSPGFCL